MTDTEFDSALVAAAFRIAGEEGWRHVNVAAAARAAGLPIAEARARFVDRAAILVRFGRLADQAALADAPSEGPVRDRLFDLLMRRFDAHQAQRAGVMAVLRVAMTDPPTALLLSCSIRTSMRWMLQAAGVAATGLRGEIQVQGLVAVWLWTTRAWQRDDSEDLTGTMATLDTALERADQAAGWLGGGRRSAPQSPPDLPEAGALDPFDVPSDTDLPDAGASSASPPSASPSPASPLSASPLPASPPPAAVAPAVTEAGSAALGSGPQVADHPSLPAVDAAPPIVDL